MLASRNRALRQLKVAERGRGDDDEIDVWRFEELGGVVRHRANVMLGAHLCRALISCIAHSDNASVRLAIEIADQVWPPVAAPNNAYSNVRLDRLHRYAVHPELEKITHGVFSMMTRSRRRLQLTNIPNIQTTHVYIRYSASTRDLPQAAHSRTHGEALQLPRLI